MLLGAGRRPRALLVSSLAFVARALGAVPTYVGSASTPARDQEIRDLNPRMIVPLSSGCNVAGNT